MSWQRQVHTSTPITPFLSWRYVQSVSPHVWHHLLFLCLCERLLHVWAVTLFYCIWHVISLWQNQKSGRRGCSPGVRDRRRATGMCAWQIWRPHGKAASLSVHSSTGSNPSWCTQHTLDEIRWLGSAFVFKLSLDSKIWRLFSFKFKNLIVENRSHCSLCFILDGLVHFDLWNRLILVKRFK